MKLNGNNIFSHLINMMTMMRGKIMMALQIICADYVRIRPGERHRIANITGKTDFQNFREKIYSMRRGKPHRKKVMQAEWWQGSL